MSWVREDFFCWDFVWVCGLDICLERVFGKIRNWYEIRDGEKVIGNGDFI